eukprot:Awhi_evm3s9871
MIDAIEDRSPLPPSISSRFGKIQDSSWRQSEFGGIDAGVDVVVGGGDVVLIPFKGKLAIDVVASVKEVGKRNKDGTSAGLGAGVIDLEDDADKLRPAESFVVEILLESIQLFT